MQVARWMQSRGLPGLALLSADMDCFIWSTIPVLYVLSVRNIKTTNA
jgi:hypothetical protein